MTASARYLYCVLPAYDLAPAVRAPALDGGPVHPIRHRDVAVLTHACAPEPYQGSETEVRGWIAAHNAVIEEAWKSAGTVLPMSFDVIVRGDSGRGAEANVAGWLSEHHAALRSRLQALRGRVEVGVQILRDAEDSAAAAAPAGAAESASLRPRGHAYFARHQRQREQRERLELQAEAAFRRHGEMLATLVDDVQVNRPRPVRGKMMVLNLSLLTDQAGVARVGDYLEQVSQGTGTEVRFTGPWPPYSFAGTFARLKLIAEPARKAAEAGTIGEIRQRAGKYVRATEWFGSVQRIVEPKVVTRMSKTTQRELTVRCAFCSGTGRDRFGILSPPSACQVCLGRGVVEVPEPRVPCAHCRGLGVQPHTRLTCSSCGGRGAQTVRNPHLTCSRCGGSGTDPRSERHMSCSDCHGAGVVHAAGGRSPR